MAPGLGARGLIVLLSAVFMVALAYGIALPLLPVWVERAFAAGTDVGLHTGLVTGSYAMALFLFAPMWGRWSDRVGRRRILLAGLCGFVLSMAVGAAFPGPAGIYLSRFLAGAFAASILPVAQALVADAVSDRQLRARHFAWLGMASIAGLLAGPLIGGLVASAPAAGSVSLMQAGLALAAALIAALAARWLPSPTARGQRQQAAPVARRQLAILLLVSALVAAGLGAFEVGVSVRGRLDPVLGSGRLGLLFAECMLVMAAAQALVFNRWVKASSTSRLLAPSLLLLGLGLLLLPWAASATALMLATGAIAAAGGVLLPVLAFWITLAAGAMQGRELGRQSSFASLGQALGSAAAGLLAATPAPLNGGLLLTGALLAGTAAWLLRSLPGRLEPIAR